MNFLVPDPQPDRPFPYSDCDHTQTVVVRVKGFHTQNSVSPNPKPKHQKTIPSGIICFADLVLGDAAVDRGLGVPSGAQGLRGLRGLGV